MSQGLAGVRKAAKEHKEMKFTALLHHLTVDLLRESFYALKRKAAPGVDGLTWQEYETGLEGRLVDLHSRVHRGAFRAWPSSEGVHPERRRAATSVGDRGPGGQDRPTGRGHHPQRDLRGGLSGLLVWLSTGTQPASSAGCALVCAHAEAGELSLLDADIRGFFDTISHAWMLKFVQHRVADRRILRLIQKWLKAGVMEEGEWSETERGTPQGAVISPLLANIYLHYVFDLWVQAWREETRAGRRDRRALCRRYGPRVPTPGRKPTVFWRTSGNGWGSSGWNCTRTKRAGSSSGGMPKRTGNGRGEGKPETFDFLGFTHISGKNRKGYFTVKRQTIGKRLRAKLQELKQQLRRRRHDPVAQTGEWLRSVVQGYFNYHAVPGNLDSLWTFRERLNRLWRTQLRQRSQRHRLNWDRVGRLAARWLPASARSASLALAALRRYASEIRAVCANQRTYGSVRGVPGNRYPYRDLWKKWGRSRNVVENTYSYTFKAGMLLNINGLAKESRSGAHYRDAQRLRP